MFEIGYVLKAILLGIIEGLTEFLPISSTGHLIIAERVLGMPNDPFLDMFTVVIQLGAILAIVVLYWPTLRTKLVSFFHGRKEGLQFMLIWVLGCVPAAVLGLLLEKIIKKHLFNTITVTAALIVGAALLLWLEKIWASHGLKNDLRQITARDALLVGLWQCVSMWPGFSRSAATIMGGWNAKMKTSLAAEYSFFLAIPVMIGASGLELSKSIHKQGGASYEMYKYIALILGFLVAFATALLVVRAFMNLIRRKPLKYFSYYRFGLGALMLVLLLTGVLTA